MDEPEAAHLRVLVVEDEPLVSMLLEDFLKDAGCDVIGPAPSLATARELLDRERPEVVLLDVNIAGELVYSFAAILAERNVPFLFVTGYSAADIAPHFRDRPVLRKPLRYRQLVQAVRDRKSVV